MMLILRYLMYTQIQGRMYGYNTQGYTHTAFGCWGGGQSGQKMKGIKRRFFSAASIERREVATPIWLCTFAYTVKYVIINAYVLLI